MSEPLDPRLLLRGYAAGIFPMADSRDAPDVFWVEPRVRAIIPIDGFHCSHSLARRLRSGQFDVTCDLDFAGVLAGCADRGETWINADIERATLGLHAAGHAHSIECWHGQGQERVLVGGVYGVRLGRAFFGESMFSRTTDASKVALAWLVARLRLGHFTLFDCQFMTKHLASLGAKSISRRRYVELLGVALGTGTSGSGGGGAGGVGTGAGSLLSVGVGGDARPLPPPDFFALDALFEERELAGASIPPGKVIVQLLGHTS